MKNPRQVLKKWCISIRAINLLIALIKKHEKIINSLI